MPIVVLPTTEVRVAAFPFVDEESEGNYFQLLAGGFPVGKRLIVINGTRPGVGKTTLARNLLMQIFNSAACQRWPGNEDQWERLIPAVIKSGHGYLYFDNVFGKVTSPTLAALCTSAQWTWRKLGTHEMETADVNLLVVITGNGIEMSEEIRRRAVVIELGDKR